MPAAPAAPKTALSNPLAGAKAAPSAARTPPKSDDDESLDLDDEDEEDEEDSAPARTPSGGLKPLPTIEKPAFTRGTIEVSTPKAAAEAPASAAQKPATVTAAKGFKGFCPVILKDERRLVEARAQFKSEYNGRWYSFSSQAAKEIFDESPQRYVPAIGGNDVVRQAAGEQGVEGSLEHAAWYRGKLFLFSTAESRREFVDEPAKFTVNE
jgi:YHS domain-containing protein